MILYLLHKGKDTKILYLLHVFLLFSHSLFIIICQIMIFHHYFITTHWTYHLNLIHSDVHNVSLNHCSFNITPYHSKLLDNSKVIFYFHLSLFSLFTCVFPILFSLFSSISNPSPNFSQAMASVEPISEPTTRSLSHSPSSPQISATTTIIHFATTHN